LRSSHFNCTDEQYRRHRGSIPAITTGAAGAAAVAACSFASTARATVASTAAALCVSVRMQRISERAVGHVVRRKHLH
jgi:hypothetical protein